MPQISETMVYCSDDFAVVEPQMYCRDTHEFQFPNDVVSTASVQVPKIVRSKGVDFVRQPCKARGVTIQPGQNPHVARFAYVDIPVGTLHGTVLSCCHPSCITSGRRFRFCTHCETAVAKRNFNVRHSHGKMNTPPPIPESKNFEDDAESDQPPFDVPATISLHTTADSSVSFQTDLDSCVGLTDQEMDFIKLLRNRPTPDYPKELDDWKVALLKATEKPSVAKHTPESFHEDDGDSVESFSPDKDEDFNDIDLVSVHDVFGFFEG